MNYSVSSPGSPHASMLLLPQEPVADKAEKDLPGSICGMGAAQGTLVAVGDGLVRKALHQDARMAGAPGDDDDDDEDTDDVFYEMDAPPEDIAGLDGNVFSDKDEDAALHNPVPVRLDSADGHQDEASGSATCAGGMSLHSIEEHRNATVGAHNEPAPFAVDEEAAQERLANETRLQQQNQSLWQKIKNWFSFELPLPGDLLDEHSLLEEDAPPTAVQPLAVSAPRDSAADVEPQVQGAWKRQIAYAVSSAFNQAQLLLGGAQSQPQLVVSKKTAQQQNSDRILELRSQIHQELIKLNQHVRNTTGKDIEDIIDLKGDLSSVEMGGWDRLFAARHMVAGGFSAATPVLGKLAGAAAVPIVAGAVAPWLGIAMLGNVAGYAAGAFLALKALQGLGEKVTDATAKSMIAEIEGKLKDAHAELRIIEREEKARADVEDLIRLAAKPRSQQINTLRKQLSHIDKALQANTPQKAGAAREAARPLRHPVTVGDGVGRAELPDAAVGMRQKFSRFFSRIADFFLARRNAANREHAYVIEAGNRKTFEALSMPALGSRLNALEVEAEKRLAPSQRSMKGLALRQRLVQGENVVRALVAAEPGFGGVAFKHPVAGDRAVAATLSTARMLAWYLDALAELPEEKWENYPHAPRVERGADGVLTVPDPGRRLSNFLMGVPTAHAGAARGEDGILIDDHSPGMPGAMSGIRFSTEATKDSHILKLSFVPKSSNQVFQQKDHHKELVRLSVTLREASAAAGEPQDNIAGRAREELLALRDDLEAKLKPLHALELEDMERLQVLANWHDPESAVERVRIAPH